MMDTNSKIRQIFCCLDKLLKALLHVWKKNTISATFKLKAIQNHFVTQKDDLKNLNANYYFNIKQRLFLDLFKPTFHMPTFNTQQKLDSVSIPVRSSPLEVLVTWLLCKFSDFIAHLCCGVFSCNLSV